MPSPAFVIIALALIWVAQSIFVYRQGRAFMQRVSALRKMGRLAIGVGQNRFRIRNFIVVVVDGNDRVVRVERLSGLTVFARSQPINRYVGLPLVELSAVALSIGAPKHVQAAIDQAVKALLEPQPPSSDQVLPDTADPGRPDEPEGGVPISQTI